MKYIFLDVDGVLNSSERWHNCRLVSADRASKIDDRAVKRLLKIVEATGAVVVITSVWRRYDDMLTGLCETLFAAGIDVVGYTSWQPALGRVDEIQKWLKESDGYEAYVVLDDESLAIPHHVQTMFETGLLDEHIEQAIDWLR